MKVQYDSESISSCVGETVPTDSFSENDIIKIIDQYEEYESYCYDNEYYVVELLDGRYAWIAECRSGTCDICASESTEVIVSNSLLKLWDFALTDVARMSMKKFAKLCK